MERMFGQRLRSARVMAGLSQDKLVERIGGVVSKNAISKYEKGQMLPNSALVTALAKALDVKIDYFFEEEVTIENIEFRKRSKLGKKQIDAIREKVVYFVSNYLELEQLLGIEAEFENPLNSIVVRNGEDVEAAADTLLESWDLGTNAIPNVVDLLEEKEIKVVEVDAPNEFDGFSGIVDGKYPVVVLNKNFGLERKRMTALHELAHLLLQFDSALSHKEIEGLCLRFAGALLIPRRTFFREFGQHRTGFSKNELVALKQSYGMSVTAIMKRAHSLGCISSHRYKQFCIAMSSNRLEEGLGEYVGREESMRFKKLLYRAASEEVISMSKAASLLNLNLAQFRKEFVAI